MFNLQETMLKLRFGKQSADAGAVTYDDLISGSCSFTLTLEEGLELAKYVLGVDEVRSWTGHLLLHTNQYTTGIKHIEGDTFTLSTSLTKFICSSDRLMMNRILSSTEQLELAKFFLGIEKELIVDSKIVLRTCFTRDQSGNIELHGD